MGSSQASFVAASTWTWTHGLALICIPRTHVQHCSPDSSRCPGATMGATMNTMATMGSGTQAPMQTASYRPGSSPQKSQVETLYQRSADLGDHPTPALG